MAISKPKLTWITNLKISEIMKTQGPFLHEQNLELVHTQ